MRNIIGKKFYKQLVKDGKCLNTKLKYYDGKIKTNNRLSRLNTTQKSSPCFCYLFCKIKIEDDKYYPQIYLEECRYGEKKSKKKKRHIKGKTIISDSDKIVESDESDDESTQ